MRLEHKSSKHAMKLLGIISSEEGVIRQTPTITTVAERFLWRTVLRINCSKSHDSKISLTELSKLRKLRNIPCTKIAEKSARALPYTTHPRRTVHFTDNLSASRVMLCNISRIKGYILRNNHRSFLAPPRKII